MRTVMYGVYTIYIQEVVTMIRRTNICQTLKFKILLSGKVIIIIRLDYRRFTLIT